MSEILGVGVVRIGIQVEKVVIIKNGKITISFENIEVRLLQGRKQNLFQMNCYRISVMK